MPQVFHSSANAIAKIVVVGFPLMVVVTGVSASLFYRSSYATGVHEVVEQPAPFSHAHHVGQLGIDCRYCHTSVETSGFAGLPPTKTCMNCHQQMWVGADMLQVVRQSYKDDSSIPWNRVHNLPHFAYFNHSIHINKGVGCVECHGRVDEMPLLYQANTLLMEWCLECHRNPAPRLRPREEVFNMTWKPTFPLVDQNGQGVIDPNTKKGINNAAEMANYLMDTYKVRDPMTLTSCSVCHR
jgi:hypothetical protein